MSKRDQPNAAAQPIQVRSEALRGWQHPGGHETGGWAALVPEVVEEAPDDCPGPRGEFLEVDVQRAINAARRAGLDDYRVEIAPDGTISIIVSAPRPD